MSVGNNSASDVQEILEFLSCLVAGDFSKNLSRPQDQIILGQIVEKLNENLN